MDGEHKEAPATKAAEVKEAPEAKAAPPPPPPGDGDKAGAAPPPPPVSTSALGLVGMGLQLASPRGASSPLKGTITEEDASKPRFKYFLAYDTATSSALKSKGEWGCFDDDRATWLTHGYKRKVMALTEPAAAEKEAAAGAAAAGGAGNAAKPDAAAVAGPSAEKLGGNAGAAASKNAGGAEKPGGAVPKAAQTQGKPEEKKAEAKGEEQKEAAAAKQKPDGGKKEEKQEEKKVEEKKAPAKEERKEEKKVEEKNEKKAPAKEERKEEKKEKKAPAKEEKKVEEKKQEKAPAKEEKQEEKKVEEKKQEKAPAKEEEKAAEDVEMGDQEQQEDASEQEKDEDAPSSVAAQSGGGASGMVGAALELAAPKGATQPIKGTVTEEDPKRPRYKFYLAFDDATADAMKSKGEWGCLDNDRAAWLTHKCKRKVVASSGLPAAPPANDGAGGSGEEAGGSTPAGTKRTRERRERASTASAAEAPGSKRAKSKAEKSPDTPAAELKEKSGSKSAGGSRQKAKEQPSAGAPVAVGTSLEIAPPKGATQAIKGTVTEEDANRPRYKYYLTFDKSTSSAMKSKGEWGCFDDDRSTWFTHGYKRKVVSLTEPAAEKDAAAAAAGPSAAAGTSEPSEAAADAPKPEGSSPEGGAKREPDVPNSKRVRSKSGGHGTPKADDEKEKEKGKEEAAAPEATGGEGEQAAAPQPGGGASGLIGTVLELAAPKGATEPLKGNITEEDASKPRYKYYLTYDKATSSAMKSKGEWGCLDDDRATWLTHGYKRKVMALTEPAAGKEAGTAKEAEDESPPAKRQKKTKA